MCGACSCDRKKLLWPPEFTSVTHAVTPSWPSGQLSAVTASGSYRPLAVVRQRSRADIRTSAPLSYQTRPVEMYHPASAAQLRDSNLSPRQGSRGCQSPTGKLRVRVAVLVVETPPRFSEAVRILDDPGPQRDHANEQVHARVG